MRVHLTHDTGPGARYSVWVSLDETETRELPDAGESFIIASGETRDEALGAAARVLVTGAERCVNATVELGGE